MKKANAPPTVKEKARLVFIREKASQAKEKSRHKHLVPGPFTLNDGIPVLRAVFEQAVANSTQRPQSNVSDYASFNEKDATVMRELVYGTDRLVIRDDVIMATLKTEINSFLGGQISAEDAAKQIQGRMSLYMAEHYG